MTAMREAAKQALQAAQCRGATTSTDSTSALAQPEREPAPLKPAGGAHVVRNVARCAERLSEPHRSEFIALHQEADRLLAIGWSMRRSAWSLYRREMEWLR